MSQNQNISTAKVLIERINAALRRANKLRVIRRETWSEYPAKVDSIEQERDSIFAEAWELLGFNCGKTNKILNDETSPRAMAKVAQENLELIKSDLQALKDQLETYVAKEEEEGLRKEEEFTDPGVPRFRDLLLVEVDDNPPNAAGPEVSVAREEERAAADRIAKIVNEDQSVLPMPGARLPPGSLSGAKRAAGTPIPPPDGTPPGVAWTSHDEGRTLAWRTPASPNPNDASSEAAAEPDGTGVRIQIALPSPPMRDDRSGEDRRAARPTADDHHEERAEWGPGTLDEPVAPGPAVVPLFERAPAATGAKPPPRKGKEVRPPPMRVADKDGGDTSLLWIVWLVAGAVAVGVGFVFAVFYGGQVVEKVGSTWEGLFDEEVTSANSSTVANTGDGSQALDCSKALDVGIMDLDGTGIAVNVVGIPVHGGATVLYMGGWSLAGGQCFLPNDSVASIDAFAFVRNDLKRALGDSPRGEGMTNPVYNTAYGMVVCNPGSGPVTYCFAD